MVETRQTRYSAGLDGDQSTQETVIPNSQLPESTQAIQQPESVHILPSNGLYDATPVGDPKVGRLRAQLKQLKEKVKEVARLEKQAEELRQETTCLAEELNINLTTNIDEIGGDEPQRLTRGVSADANQEIERNEAQRHRRHRHRHRTP